jgi:ABC-type antimicrobial peptide transport system permease subunit
VVEQRPARTESCPQTEARTGRRGPLIGLGIGIGGTLVVLTFVGMFQSAPTSLEVGMIAAYATLMLLVCLSACIVPTRRALRLEPSQVLRADG